MRATSKLALTTLALGLLAGLPVTAADFQDTAWVISSRPVYENINQPRRECWTEQVGYDSGYRYESAPRDSNVGGAIIGGLVGGLLGNTVGKGSGKKAATVVGATTGAIVGSNMGDRDRYVYRDEPQPRYEERCRTVDNIRRELTGYEVTYRYQNRDYTAFLPHDPGRTVRVNVSVSLAERY